MNLKYTISIGVTFPSLFSIKYEVVLFEQPLV